MPPSWDGIGPADLLTCGVGVSVGARAPLVNAPLSRSPPLT
ncbi:hypothetical protein [Streptomyces sp. NPDC023327]